MADDAADDMVPLAISDYSCDNRFEQLVDAVERFVGDVASAQPRVAAWLQLQPRRRPRRSDAAGDNAHDTTRGGDDSSSSNDNDGDDGAHDGHDASLSSSSSVHTARSLSSGSSNNNDDEAVIVRHSFALAPSFARRRRNSSDNNSDANASASDAIVVEVHLHDKAHIIAHLFHLSCFLLIGRAAAHGRTEPAGTYRASESAFYLSILVTAVTNVLSSAAMTTATTTSTATTTTTAPCCTSQLLMSSPHTLHARCIPCLVPVGDTYACNYMGAAPPVTHPHACALTTTTAAAHACDDAAADAAADCTPRYTRLACTSTPASAPLAVYVAPEGRYTHVEYDKNAHNNKRNATTYDDYNNSSGGAPLLLTSLLDRFLLHMGTHSRVVTTTARPRLQQQQPCRRDDDNGSGGNTREVHTHSTVGNGSGGVCTSLCASYVLHMPWRLGNMSTPRTTTHATAAAATAAAGWSQRGGDDSSSHNNSSNSTDASANSNSSGTSNSNDASNVYGTTAAALAAGQHGHTWLSVVRRENAALQRLCGPCALAFGTEQMPIDHIQADVYWRELSEDDVQALCTNNNNSSSNSNKGSRRAVRLSDGWYAPTAFAPSSATAAQQRVHARCRVVVKAVVKEEHRLSHAVHATAGQLVQRAVACMRRHVAHTRRQGSSGHYTTQAEATTATTRQRRSSSSSSSGGGRGGRAQAASPTPRQAQSTAAQNNNNNSVDAGGDNDDDGDGEDDMTSADTRQLPRGDVDVLAAQVVSPAHLHALHTSAAGDSARTLRLVSALHHDTAATQYAKGSSRGSSGKASLVRDLRRVYPPGSLLSRLACVCTSHTRDHNDSSSSSSMTEDNYTQKVLDSLLELWRACVVRIKTRYEQHSGNDAHNTSRSGAADVLDILGLPAADPPVDLTQTLLVQKLQLLAYHMRCLAAAAHSDDDNDDDDNGKSARSDTKATAGHTNAAATRALAQATDGWDSDTCIDDDDSDAHDGAAVDKTSADGKKVHTTGTHDKARRQQSQQDDGSNAATATSNTTHGMQLITHGEPLVVPPPLPEPPTTSDVLLQRSQQLQQYAHTSSDTRLWLQSSTLYNDMCLFLYVNNAQHGRVVRFADFVQWHSPRDFHWPDAHTRKSDKKQGDAAAHEQTTVNDNDYLSERMQLQGDSATGNVWWALWQRARPRSLRDISNSTAGAHEQALLVLHWLQHNVTAHMLLVDVVNAALANASHRLLSHRYIVGDAQQDNIQTKQTKERAARDNNSPCGNDDDDSTPTVPDVRAYVREQCGRVYAAVAAVTSLCCDVDQSLTFDESTVNAISGQYELAIGALAHTDTCLCVAVALHHLLGVHSTTSSAVTARAAALARSLSAPASCDGDDEFALHQGGTAVCCADVSSSNTRCLHLREHHMHMAEWHSILAPLFATSEQLPTCVHARLSCTAERPLRTAPCFQQYVLHTRRDEADVYTTRLATILVEEVL